MKIILKKVQEMGYTETRFLPKKSAGGMDDETCQNVSYYRDRLFNVARARLADSYLGRVRKKVREKFGKQPGMQKKVEEGIGKLKQEVEVDRYDKLKVDLYVWDSYYFILRLAKDFISKEDQELVKGLAYSLLKEAADLINRKESI